MHWHKEGGTCGLRSVRTEKTKKEGEIQEVKEEEISTK